MIKSIFLKALILSLLFIVGSVYAATEDHCSQMNNEQFQGTYAWTYRGDHFQLSATANSTYLSAHHYSVIMQIHNDIPSTIELKGTCMNSQIYLEEDSSAKFPAYLQGTINNNRIMLTGHRGPNVLSILLIR